MGIIEQFNILCKIFIIYYCWSVFWLLYAMFGNFFNKKSLNREFQEAVRLHRSGENLNACKIYKNLLDNDFNLFECNYNLGLIHCSIEDYEQAIYYLNDALIIRPNDFRVFYIMGIVLSKMGMYEKSLKFFDYALESGLIEKFSARFWSERGLSLFHLNRFEEALKSYDNSLKIDPNRINVLNNKGIVLSNLSRYEEALNSYNKSLKINLTDIDVLNNKVDALINLNRFEEALDVINEIFMLDENNIPALTNKGLLMG